MTSTGLHRPAAEPQADRRRGIWTRRAPRDALLDAPVAHDSQQSHDPRDDAGELRAGVWALPASAGRLLAA